MADAVVISGAMDIQQFDNTSTLINAAAAMFVNTTNSVVRQDGRCTVALSGGSTPRALYECLAREPFVSSIPWGQLEIFWSDERWVSEDDKDSNYRMANESLLSKVPIRPAQIHSMRGSFDTPDHAARAYDGLLRTRLASAPNGVPRFNLLMLGMGADGHTASLFPHSPANTELERFAVATHVDKLNADRITVTTPILRAADMTMLMVTGVEKAATLAHVLHGPVDVQSFPAQSLRVSMRGPVHWLIDAAAASALPPDMKNAPSI